jgi:hypothetical protein
MVCLGNICINTLHKGAKDDDDDDDDDNDDDGIIIIIIINERSVMTDRTMHSNRPDTVIRDTAIK